jgi:hypothetical protein
MCCFSAAQYVRSAISSLPERERRGSRACLTLAICAGTLLGHRAALTQSMPQTMQEEASDGNNNDNSEKKRRLRRQPVAKLKEYQELVYWRRERLQLTLPARQKELQEAKQSAKDTAKTVDMIASKARPNRMKAGRLSWLKSRRKRTSKKYTCHFYL